MAHRFNVAPTVASRYMDEMNERVRRLLDSPLPRGSYSLAPSTRVNMMIEREKRILARIVKANPDMSADTLRSILAVLLTSK